MIKIQWNCIFIGYRFPSLSSKYVRSDIDIFLKVCRKISPVLLPFNLHNKVIVWPQWLSIDRVKKWSTSRTTSCRMIAHEVLNFRVPTLVVHVGYHFMDFGSPREKLVVCGRRTWLISSPIKKIKVHSCPRSCWHFQVHWRISDCSVKLIWIFSF